MMRPEQKPRFENCWIWGVRCDCATGARISPESLLGTATCQVHPVKVILFKCSSFPNSYNGDPAILHCSSVFRANAALPRPPFFICPVRHRQPITALLQGRCGVCMLLTELCIKALTSPKALCQTTANTSPCQDLIAE